MENIRIKLEIWLADAVYNIWEKLRGFRIKLSGLHNRLYEYRRFLDGKKMYIRKEVLAYAKEQNISEEAASKWYDLIMHELKPDGYRKSNIFWRTSLQMYYDLNWNKEVR